MLRSARVREYGYESGEGEGRGRREKKRGEDVDPACQHYLYWFSRSTPRSCIKLMGRGKKKKKGVHKNLLTLVRRSTLKLEEACLTLQRKGRGQRGGGEEKKKEGKKELVSTTGPRYPVWLE